MPESSKVEACAIGPAAAAVACWTSENAPGLAAVAIESAPDERVASAEAKVIGPAIPRRTVRYMINAS
jgi:hypothetical protein